MKTNENISPQTIKAYLAGTLSHAQTHEFEKAMLNDAVLRDSIEGYEISRDKNIDFNSVNASLSERLEKRIGEEQPEIYPLWKRVPLYARAASVLLFLGIGAYFLINRNEDKFTAKLASIPTSKEEKIADIKSIPPVENPMLKDNIKVEIKKKKEEIAIQNSKTKITFDSVISSGDAVAIESKREKEVEIETVSKSEPTIAYESIPVPVQQAPKSAAPTGVMKSEEKVYSRRKTVENQTNTEILRGTILDEDSNKPVPNVAIISEDKTIGKTDENGHFNLENAQLGNKINLVAPNFENTEIIVNKTTSDLFYIRPKSELIFIDLKRNKMWKYNPAEHPAQPSVSPDEYLEYLQKNLKKSKQAIDNQIVGAVEVEFRVNKKGELSDFKITKSLGYGLDEEAIRIIREGPKWLPKTYGRNTGRQRVRQVVNF